MADEMRQADEWISEAEAEVDRLNLELSRERACAEQAEARVVRAEQERDRVLDALEEAIEWGDEGWAYASKYFQTKWDYAGEREKLVAVLREHGREDNDER